MVKHLLLPMFFGFCALAASPWDGTFFEPIQTVQKNHLALPADGYDKALSIPYTRIDIVLDNGVALMRVLQVYHNHSGKNQGYAFQYPISTQTVISQFNLWDRGTLYPGTIQGRVEAEKVYREVTGDETPTLNMDPGLVRRAWSRYHMRVFPIFPGEDKQVELLSHELIPADTDTIHWSIDLQRLLTSTDRRHPGIRSLKTDVSIFVRDAFGVENLKCDGLDGAFQAFNQGFVFRKTLGDHIPGKVSFNYHLSAASKTDVYPRAFSDGSDAYFLLRVRSGKDRIRAEAPPPPPERPFYIGVWHGDQVVKEDESTNSVFRELGWEFFGYQILCAMDCRAGYHGSWKPPNIQNSDKLRESLTPKQAIVSSELKKNVDLKTLLGKRFFESSAGTEPARLSVGVAVNHLREKIKTAGCDHVILFLDDIEAEMWKRLTAVIQDSPRVNFILVTGQEKLPKGLSALKNVAHLCGDHWRIKRPFLAKRQVANKSTDPLMAALFPDLSLPGFKPLLECLPGYLGFPRAIRSHGSAGISDIRAVSMSDSDVWGGGDSRKSADQIPPVVWLSGKYKQSGSVDLSLPLNNPLLGFFDLMLLEKTPDPSPVQWLDLHLNLPKPQSGNRFVGAVWARANARRLTQRLQELRGGEGRGGERNTTQNARSKDPEREAEIARVKEELVALSKKFSFITAETAFIALPPELIEKYGFQPQGIQGPDLFSPGTPTLPEPNTLLLLTIGALFMSRGRRRQRR